MTPEEEKDKLINQVVDFRVFMAETVVYRKTQNDTLTSLNAKVDTIVKSLSNLPCRERAYIPDQLKAIWAVISALSLSIIWDWLKGNK